MGGFLRVQFHPGARNRSDQDGHFPILGRVADQGADLNRDERYAPGEFTDAAKVYFWMKGHLWRILMSVFDGNGEAAVDLLTDAFIEFLEELERGNVYKGGPVAYFKSICMHRIFRARKACAESLNLEFKEKNYPVQIGTDRSKEIVDVIDSVLASDVLPDFQRKAFGHIRVLGRSMKDTARLLGRNRVNVWRALMKADRVFREILEKRGLDPESLEVETRHDPDCRKAFYV